MHTPFEFLNLKLNLQGTHGLYSFVSYSEKKKLIKINKSGKERVKTNGASISKGLVK